jgi:hypothetical protein
VEDRAGEEKREKDLRSTTRDHQSSTRQWNDTSWREVEAEEEEKTNNKKEGEHEQEEEEEQHDDDEQTLVNINTRSF